MGFVIFFGGLAVGILVCYIASLPPVMRISAAAMRFFGYKVYAKDYGKPAFAEQAEEHLVLNVLACHPVYCWRSIGAISKVARLPYERVEQIIAKCHEKGLVVPHTVSENVWGLYERVKVENPERIKENWYGDCDCKPCVSLVSPACLEEGNSKGKTWCWNQNEE